MGIVRFTQRHPFLACCGDCEGCSRYIEAAQHLYKDFPLIRFGSKNPNNLDEPRHFSGTTGFKIERRICKTKSYKSALKSNQKGRPKKNQSTLSTESPATPDPSFAVPAKKTRKPKKVASLEEIYAIMSSQLIESGIIEPVSSKNNKPVLGKKKTRGKHERQSSDKRQSSRQTSSRKHSSSKTSSSTKRSSSRYKNEEPDLLTTGKKKKQLFINSTRGRRVGQTTVRIQIGF